MFYFTTKGGNTQKQRLWVGSSAWGNKVVKERFHAKKRGVSDTEVSGYTTALGVYGNRAAVLEKLGAVLAGKDRRDIQRHGNCSRMARRIVIFDDQRLRMLDERLT